MTLTKNQLHWTIWGKSFSSCYSQEKATYWQVVVNLRGDQGIKDNGREEIANCISTL